MNESLMNTHQEEGPGHKLHYQKWRYPMNRTGLVIIIILLSALTGSTAFGAAKITIDEYSYSAGNVMQGKAIEHDFAIRNTGNEPLTLELKSCESCNGIKVTPPVGPVDPGKTDKIHVRIPTYNMRGSFKKGIEVITNDPDKNNVTLIVQAFIQEVLSIKPEYISLGQVKTGSKYQKAITVENSGREPVSIYDIELSPPEHLTLSPNEKMVIKPGEKKTLLLTITSGKEPGVIEGSIFLRTDLKQMPQKLIPVQVEVTRDIKKP